MRLLCELSVRSPLAEQESVTMEELKRQACILISSREQQNTEEDYYKNTLGFGGRFLFAENLEEGRLMVAGNRGFLPVERVGTLPPCGTGVKRLPVMERGQQLKRNYCLFWVKENASYYIEEFAEILEKTSERVKYLFGGKFVCKEIPICVMISIERRSSMLKQLKIPVGVSDFRKIRENGYYYMDKSGLIEELLKTDATEVTLITRPRRFGKTLGMSMLDNFLDIRKDSRYLFSGLKISQNQELCRKWMNQWPTLFLSFKDVDGSTFGKCYGAAENLLFLRFA